MFSVSIVFCIGLIAVIALVKRPTSHELAMERFDTLRKGGFKAPEGEMYKAIYDCFPKGMEASKVQRLLDTAGKRALGNGETEFSWEIDFGDHSHILCVVIGGSPGYPPIIVRIDWIILPGT